MNPTTQEYRSALDKVRQATAVFSIFQAEYRARNIDDATFLNERRKYEHAQSDFDIAFAKEQAIAQEAK